MDLNSCKNCLHYAQHYVICQGKLLRLGQGHCTNASKASKNPTVFCKEWEQELSATETLEPINKRLAKIAKELINIALILESQIF